MTSTRMHSLFLGLLLVVLTSLALAAEAPEKTTHNPESGQFDVARDPDTGRFDASKLAPQPLVRVKGNRFVRGDNETFIFRGVNVADPDKIEKDGQWNKGLFEELHRWGANTIRLPIHPRAWRERGPDDYMALLDQAVVWANELDMYLILDWHSIGYLETGRYQNPMYYTDKQETFRFWHDIAYRYQGVPTTAVYELFNEPTTLDKPWGETEVERWVSLNEIMIDIIYALDPNVIPAVAGFNWAYDLRFVKDRPVERDGIAYIAHPYPQKAKPKVPSKENFFELWEQVWGFASKEYPLILSEMGWVQPDGKGAHIPVMNDGSYGPQIMEFIHERGLSWTAWVFDPQWSPTMIENWDYKPTEQGVFFRDVMQADRKKEQPAAR